MIYTIGIMRVVKIDADSDEQAMMIANAWNGPGDLMLSATDVLVVDSDGTMRVRVRVNELPGVSPNETPVR